MKPLLKFALVGTWFMLLMSAVMNVYSAVLFVHFLAGVYAYASLKLIDENEKLRGKRR